MKKIILALFLFVCCRPAAAQSQKALLEKFSAPVVAVHDGDTLTILHNGQQEKIRLFGVDAPETKQEFGTQAKQFTSARVFGKTVTIAPENRDRYGRTVAWVFDGQRTVNEELVEAGFAWWYRDYARKETQLGELQENARARKVGLWATSNPVEPWEWRRGERERRVTARESATPSTPRRQAPRKTTKKPTSTRTTKREPEAPQSIWWILAVAIGGILLNLLKRQMRKRR
jgi:endonuclease YncB( thermonuclease family)